MRRTAAVHRAFFHALRYLTPSSPSVDPDACAALIKQCQTLNSVKSVHASMLRSHHLYDCGASVLLTTALVSQYALLGSMPSAFAAFAAEPFADVFLWNVVIKGFADNGEHGRAVALYHQMREAGVCPDNYTYPVVLKACAQLRDLEEGRRVHFDVLELGYETDVFVGNSLVDMYGKCGSVDVAREMFDGMTERSMVTWSAMVGAYMQNGSYGEALSLFRRMMMEGVRPGRATFLNVMPCVCKGREADVMYGLVVVNGLDGDLRVQNAAMGMFARCGRAKVARRLFNRMPEKDFVSWTSMIEAYGLANMHVEALNLFKKMKAQGIVLDYVTVLSLIRACSSSMSLPIVRSLHGFLVRGLFGRNVVLESALIDLYVKCGNLRIARKLFDRMKERNLISWSTMISGYGMHGQGKEALDLFDQMKAVVRPDHIAFVAVLSACSHSGLMDEGWRYFNSMTKDFNIAPQCAHYACMVDLLGRNGKLKEALQFIKCMPTTPDASVWGSLLGACRIHLNVEIAEVAAKYLFALDSENPGRYVLLSNIYTFSGKRDEAESVRDLMRRKGLKQTTAQSIIEIRNNTYKFIVGDRSHPHTDLIYKELEKLMGRIRKEGYVPNTNLVLLDVEEEAKENLLYVHSEKLAIVFGLLNSGPTTEIVIHKNLRICGDCHNAVKLISKVTRRVIVVRDTHRFHHFKDGRCSCMDYW